MRRYVRYLVCGRRMHQVESDTMTKPAKSQVSKPKSIPPRLLEAAIVAFGSEDTAKEWWWSTHEFTLQMCPAKLVQTPKGRKFLKDYLNSVIDLNYGSFS